MKVVLLQVVLKNGLYQLHIPPASNVTTDHNLPTSSSTTSQHSLHNSNSFSKRVFCNFVDSGYCITQNVEALWHKRLGHPNRMVLNKVLTRLQVPNVFSTASFFCDASQYGKLHQHSFPSSVQHTTKPFQIVHSDVWGHAPHISLEGYKYYVSFVDGFTRYTWIFPIELKYEVPPVFLHFNKMVERQFNAHIKCLQSNRGGEYPKLQSIMREVGIIFRHPYPHTHQQGKAESKHRNNVETGLTLLAKASMDLNFWWEAFVSATSLLLCLITFLPSSLFLGNL